MYKHILLPIDGSELSRQATVAAIELARDSGAKVTALHVIPSARPDLLEAWAHEDPHYERRRRSLYSRFADGYLSHAAQIAAGFDVPCDLIKVEGSAPYRVIVVKARELHCDLVFMASHGWGGNELQPMGGETLKVAMHSPVPVLIYKPPPAQPA